MIVAFNNLSTCDQPTRVVPDQRPLNGRCCCDHFTKYSVVCCNEIHLNFYFFSLHVGLFWNKRMQTTKTCRGWDQCDGDWAHQAQVVCTCWTKCDTSLSKHWTVIEVGGMRQCSCLLPKKDMWHEVNDFVLILPVYYCPSMLWHCWLGARKRIRSLKNGLWGVGAYVSGARSGCLLVVQLMPLHSKTPSSLASFKSRLVLHFSYWLAQVVLEKRPLNGCSSSSSLPVYYSLLSSAYFHIIVAILYTICNLDNEDMKTFCGHLERIGRFGTSRGR